MEAQGFSKSLLVKRYENSIPSRMKVWKERLAVHKLWRSDESRDELHRQNRSDGRRGSSADIHTWMLWPVLGDDGLSPTSPPASASVKGVNKLAPLLLCAPCKPTSHRKNQNSTQWYVQQVNNTTQHNSQRIRHPRFTLPSRSFALFSISFDFLSFFFASFICLSSSFSPFSYFLPFFLLDCSLLDIFFSLLPDCDWFPFRFVLLSRVRISRYGLVFFLSFFFFWSE